MKPNHQLMFSLFYQHENNNNYPYGKIQLLNFAIRIRLRQVVENFTSMVFAKFGNLYLT